MEGSCPQAKVDKEIAEIRGVPEHQDVISPPIHSAFEGPTGLLHFVQHLREMSDGKPIGFKLCIGRPSEFMAICKAMLETGILPDFITIDGAEGRHRRGPGRIHQPSGYATERGTDLRQQLPAWRGIARQDPDHLLGQGGHGL